MSDTSPNIPTEPPELRPGGYPDVIPSIYAGEYYTSFAYVASKGRMEAVAERAITFDRNAADDTATEYRRIATNLAATLVTDPNLRTMDTAEQQAAYEQALAQHAYNAIKDTLFDPDKYRVAIDDGTTTRRLNSLRQVDEYDCEHLTYIRGLLMHEGDAAIVAAGLRQNPTMFYAAPGARMSIGEEAGLLAGHQFIVSAVTGNVVESTQNGHGYIVTKTDFDELVAGYPALSEASVYAASPNDTHEHIAKERLNILRASPHDATALGNLQQADTYNSMPLSDTAQKKFDLLQPIIASGVETKCSESVPVKTESGIEVNAASAPLMTEAYPTNACLLSEYEITSARVYTSTATEDLARNFVSSSGKKISIGPAENVDNSESKSPSPSPAIPPSASLHR